MIRRSTSYLFIRNLGLLGFGGLALTPLLLACAAELSAADAGSDSSLMNDAGAAADASSTDSGPIPAAPPEADSLWLGAARGSETMDTFGGDDATCFDGVDNDSAENDTADGVDCDDPQCQTLPSCCANEAACVGEPVTVVDEDFEACSDAICGHDFIVFGGPEEPVIDSGSLALQGDNDFDTGLYGNEVLNLHDQRIEMEIQFRLGECGEDCIESAAVALSAQEAPGDSTFIRPLVGLRAISAVNEVQLIIHDRVAATFPAGDLSVPWNLSVLPSGQVELTRDGSTTHKEFVPAGAAHLVLFGHSSNPSVERVGARIEALKVERFATDRVDAWSRDGSLELPGGRVSAARVGGVDYLAINDSISDAPDRVRFRLASDGSTLIWLFDTDWGAEDYAVAAFAGSIHVYAISQDGDLLRGAVDLVRSEVAAPETIPMPAGWNSVGNPTLIEANGTLVLVAEVDGALGAAFLAQSNNWVSLDSLPLLTAGAREPSLVTHNGVYWLHYTVQHGTRQRVRAMVSDQMFHWRDLGDALGGSGEVGSVDRFSVASPALISDGDSLRMYYVADNHIVRRVAVAERLSPAGRRR